MLNAYRPSWFYCHHLLACVVICLTTVKPKMKITRVEDQANSDVGGHILYDVCYQEETKSD